MRDESPPLGPGGKTGPVQPLINSSGLARLGTSQYFIRYPWQLPRCSFLPEVKFVLQTGP